jgi:hypothetical protein
VRRYMTTTPTAKVALVWLVALLTALALHFVALKFGIQVPPTFVGVVAGSALTLTGVYLTNAAAERRQADQFAHDLSVKREQFTHEWELKRDERLKVARREVYLDAVEGVAAGMSLIPRLSDLEADDKTVFADWLGKVPAIARTSVVSETSTFVEIQRFNSELATAIGVLAVDRGRLKAMRKQLVDAQVAPCDANAQLTTQLERRVAEGRVALLLKCIGEIGRLQPLQIPLLLAVRAELEVATDSVLLAACVRETADNMQQKLTQILKNATAGLM